MYADAVVDVIGERRPVIVVGHSLGGFTAPLVCARVPVDLLVLVRRDGPGSRRTVRREWWTNAAYEDSASDDVFYQDVPPELAARARRHERDENAKALREPWPLDAWPQTATRYLLDAYAGTLRAARA